MLLSLNSNLDLNPDLITVSLPGSGKGFVVFLQFACHHKADSLLDLATFVCIIILTAGYSQIGGTSYSCWRFLSVCLPHF